MKGYSFGELVKLAEAALPKTDNAVSATKLLNSRAIGGVQFNGTHDISLPGVNLPGNQDTTGRAAVASGADKLTTARRINGVPFDGTSDVTIEAGAVGTYTKAEIDAKDNTRLSLSGGTMQGPLIMAPNSTLDGHNTVARYGDTADSYTHYYNDINGPETRHAMRFATGKGGFNAFLFSGNGHIYSDLMGRVFSEGAPPSPAQVGAVSATSDNTKVQTKSFGLRVAAGYGEGTTGGWARDFQVANGLDSAKSISFGGYGGGGSIEYGYFGHNDGGANAYASPNMFRAYETYPAWGENRIFHQGYLPSLGALGAAPAAHTHNTLDVMSIGNWNTTTEGCGFVQAIGAPNNPTSTNHWYWGINMQHGTGYGMQLISQHGEEKFYIRDKDNSGAGSWARIYTTLNRPTPEEVGALPIGGGALTGNVHSPGFFPHANNSSSLGNSDWRFSEGWVNNLVTSRVRADDGIGLNQNAGTGVGISLYGGIEHDPSYGIMFATNATGGNHGAVTGDWATYFNMTGANNRGWVFRHKGVKNCASISTDGHATFNGNVHSYGALLAVECKVDHWFRVMGSGGGLYFEQFGGGINMIDNTWVRVYGGKQFHIESRAGNALDIDGGAIIRKGIRTDNIGTSWIEQKDIDTVPVQMFAQRGAYAAGTRWACDEVTFSVGCLANAAVGFYGWNNGTTENRTDFSSYLSNDGRWYMSGGGYLGGPLEIAAGPNSLTCTQLNTNNKQVLATSASEVYLGNGELAGIYLEAKATTFTGNMHANGVYYGNGSGLTNIPRNAVIYRHQTLYDNVAGINLGNFVLSAPWYNYNELVFITGSDDGVYRYSVRKLKYEIEVLQGSGKPWNICADANNYWNGSFASDGVTFVTNKETCRVYGVIGFY